MKIKQTARLGSRRAAFTLVECVVGMALVSIVVGALYTGMSYGMKRTAFTREDMRATQIMLEKMEQLRLYGWDQILSNLDPDDLDDPTFDTADPHVVADDLTKFTIPNTFTVPFTPGMTNSGALVYNGTFSITNAPISEVYSNELMLITVSLSWQNGSQTRTRQMQTFFAKYGMQNLVP